MGRSTKFCCVLVALVVASLTASPAHAANGTYTQHLCFDSDNTTGVGVPPEIRIDLAGVPLSFVTACSGSLEAGKGLSLVTGLPEQTADRDRGGLTYIAPPNLKILSGHYYRAFKSPGNGARFVITENGEDWRSVYGLPRGESFYWYGTGNGDGNLVNAGTFATPLAPANGPISIAIGDQTHWHIAWGCDTNGGGPCTVTQGSLEHRIFAGRLELRDESAPRLTAPIGGTLSIDNPVRGVQTVTLAAEDAGAGVYRALLLVDGKVASAAVVDDNSGACRDVNPANADVYEFGRAVPCKTSASGTFGLDTTNVPDGAHNVRVAVEDAAGNATIVIDRLVTIDNRGDGIGPGDDPALRGPANGSPASDQAKLRLSWSRRRTQRTRRVRFSAKPRLRGRLTTPQGAPIAGARLDVRATTTRPGAKPRPRLGVVTDQRGRFTLRWPRGGPSRDIVVGYRSHINDTVTIAQAVARLRVAAAVSLRVAPRTIGARRSLTFRGRVHGKPIPRGGKLVELQYRVGSSWKALRVVRTKKSGRFNTRYRFTSTGSARVLRFRARTRFEAAFPYLSGASTTRTVRNLG